MVNDRSDDSLRQIVVEYVDAEKGWPASDYMVKFNRRDGEIAVFDVIHEDDKGSIVPGGGKSVEIHVDIERKVVTRELGFQ